MVQNTSGYFSAIATSCACLFTRVEMVTMRPPPAARARATTASSSVAKSGKSRWQWLSTSVVSGLRFRLLFGLLRRLLGHGAALGLRLDPARAHGRRRRRGPAG